jgi:hypothetical protein
MIPMRGAGRDYQLAESQNSGGWKDFCREDNGPDICDAPCRRCLRRAALCKDEETPK